MASNLSREKLLFYAAAGGLGGLGAWGAAEPFLGIRFVYARDLLLGALIGFFIGAFLACIEAMSVGQWRQALRGIRSGGVIGAFGGALGLLVGEIAFDILRLQREDPGMVGSGGAGRPRRRMGIAVQRAPAQRRNRRACGRSTGRLLLPGAHRHLSSGVRPRDRDYRARNPDRLLHRPRR